MIIEYIKIYNRLGKNYKQLNNKQKQKWSKLFDWKETDASRQGIVWF